MKRLGRAMLNTLTVGSLLLAILVAALWVRSYWRYDGVLVVSRDYFTRRRAGVEKGRVLLEIVHVDRWNHSINLLLPHSYHSTVAKEATILSHELLGIRWHRESGSQPWNGSETVVSIPHALLLALFAALPAIRCYRRIRRRHRVLPGHCNTCRYDLRATPDRCPECGMVAAGAKTGGE